MFFILFILSRNVVEPLKGKFADIGRPLNESFRHTGHGSVLGQSWGNPTFLDPAYLGDVELRGSAVASKELRKKKCSSEQYVRERKSNATKQFAYNKLKNEKHMSLNQQQQLQQQKLSKSSSSAAPKRPPQPKFDGSNKEGMLIDLSPPSELSTFTDANQRINMNMSLMDAPIDVPTEGESPASKTADFHSDNSKLEPPPYQSPPTYMNTYGLGQAFSNPASASSSDPFDTSHIVPHKPYSPLPMSNVIAAKPTNGLSLVRQRPMAIAPKTQLDELVQNTMASLSPKGSHTSLNNIDLSAKSGVGGNLTKWRASSNTSVDSNRSKSPAAQANSSSDALSDSMNVNLSSSTMPDTDTDLSMTDNDLMSSFGRSEPTKIDKTFLAELEKEMYKNEAAMSNLNVNMSVAQNNQYQNGKEYSVTAISSEVYANRLHNETMSPSRLTHSQVKAINEEVAYAKSNYESTSSIGRNYYSPTSTKKQYNTDMNSMDLATTTGGSNQVWPSTTTTADRPMSMAEINEAVRTQAIYSNFAMTNVYGNAASLAAEQKHNFVAVSNRPASATVPTNNSSRANYSVTSDIYGSIAGGNVYDVVATPHSSNSSAYYGFVMPTTAEVHSKPIDYYETVPNNVSQSVIYDEVAGEDLLRPHRPAPIAPPVLSAQQIQRRLERAQKEQQLYGNVGGHYQQQQQQPQTNGFGMDGVDAIGSQHQKVMALINDVAGDGGDANEQEARQALIAANWDHATAVRNLKIDRLSRYVQKRVFPFSTFLPQSSEEFCGHNNIARTRPILIHNLKWIRVC